MRDNLFFEVARRVVEEIRSRVIDECMVFLKDRGLMPGCLEYS